MKEIDIGLNLKLKKIEKNLSQSELARRTGLNQRNISRWELNVHIPNVLDCLTIAQFYGISIEELILGI